MARRGGGFDVVAVGAGVAMAAVALAQLFLPSAVGLADNGDYQRLVCHAGLTQAYAPGDFRARITHVTFVLHRGPAPPHIPCNYWSPAAVPVWLVSRASSLLGGSGNLDLRVLGVLYALAFGLVTALLVAALPRSRWVRLPAAAAAIVLLGDFAFVEYFTSAYSEALGLVALVATVALFVHSWSREQPSRAHLAAITVASVILASTKPQYASLAVVLALAILARPYLIDRGVARVADRAAHAAAALFVVAVAALTVHAAPKQFSAINRYDAYFYELLGHSPDPAADLRAFGLPTSLRRYAGTSWYSADNASHGPDWPAQLDRITYQRLAAFYVTHPVRAGTFAGRGFRAAAQPRLGYIGNYPAGHTGSHLACRMCLASAVTSRLAGAARVWVPLLWVVALGLGLWGRRASRREARALASGLVLTVSLAVTAFATALLGEGSYEMRRHLFMADAASALLVVLVVAHLGARFAPRSASS